MMMQSLYQTAIRGGDVKGYLLDLYKRNTGPLARLERRMDIADMPTVMAPRVSLTRDTEKLPRLPHAGHIDREGRSYIKLINIDALTIALADEVVGRFFELHNIYPDELVARPSRTARLNTYYFFPYGKIPIPFVREFVYPVDYDILARGYV